MALRTARANLSGWGVSLDTGDFDFSDGSAAREQAAMILGPFVRLPPMDPLPVPPADDAILETDVPVAPVMVTGETLKDLMGQFNRNELR